MANNSILKALTQLENDLKDINSAKEQVETVSKAYDVLQQKIKSFADSTAKLSQNVKSLVDVVSGERTKGLKNVEASLNALESASVSLLSAFEAKCNDSSSRFGNKVTGFVDSVQTGVASLHAEVVKLERAEATIKEATNVISSLKEKTELLLDELNTSQSAQDIVLADVSARLGNSQVTLNSVQLTLDSLLTDVSNKATAIQNALKQASSAIQTDIQSTKSALQSDIQQFQSKTLEQLSATQTQLAKEIKTNRYLLIVAIIILLSLLVKHFI